MKKIYSFILCLSVFGSLSAQKNIDATEYVSKQDNFSQKIKPSAQNQIKGALLWENDFSDALTWTVSIDGSNPAGWEFSTDPSVIPVGALSPFASTSAANGFLFVNSDANNSSDFDGDPIITTCTNVTPIDLSASPFVKLTLEHNYRWWQDTRGVRVSGDNGATWTDYQLTCGADDPGNCIGCEATDNYPGDQNTANPEVSSVDISATAGGMSQVLIQVYYNDNDYWGWYWAVDDIRINEIDAFDADLVDVIAGSTGYWQEVLPYFQVPAAQVAPIEFKGVVKNVGVDDVNATFMATYTGVYDGVSDPMLLSQGVQDTLTCLTTLTPPASNATHTIEYMVTTTEVEEDELNNVAASYTFEVNDFIYARDAGTSTGGTYNAGNEYESGNIFDIYSDATIYGIDVVIDAQSVEGAEVRAKLYSIDDATGDFVFVTESDITLINAEDLGNTKSFILQSASMLMTGQSYLVVVATYGDGGVSNDVVVATAGISSPNTSYYYDGTDATWYYSTSTPMVRMNFNPNLASIEETTNNSFEVYPNPASDVVNIKFNDATNAAISVLNLAGKEVMTSTVNGTQTSFSTSSLTNGVYLIKVSNGTDVQITKVIVRK
ncbi:MAG: T9SS type A sorting domain-containing protein [Crocinitomicaceae bacterium]|tara:strand:- start:1037 stop:2854 length:1818 start_codon:yes stop_codon:yes gene_type:complete